MDTSAKVRLLAAWQRRLPRSYALAMFLRHWYRPNSYCHITGYLASLGMPEPVDARGEPVPWVCYGLIAFLRERLTPDLSVFEFGSGSSTLFFARRVARVRSVEHDRRWLERNRARCPANVALLHRPARDPRGYADAILEQGERFDLVFVDGLERVACLANALRSLTPGGVVLLDDSQRPEHVAAAGLAGDLGFRRLAFEGLKPGGFSLEQSTLFYRDGNCLGV